MEPDYIKGFTLLGGDPFEPENCAALVPFMKRMRKLYPEKSVWCFTGTVLKLLRTLDVLVDGRFVEELKDLNLRFRGSSNQRIISVKESLKKDKIVLWDGEAEQ